MVMNDPIGDLLARIRNAQMRKRSDVITPASKLRAWVLDALHSEGFIRGYKAVESEDGKTNIVIDLKSDSDGKIISEAVSHLGIETISGSASKEKLSSFRI